jgi:hypothetical protein
LEDILRPHGQERWMAKVRRVRDLAERSDGHCIDLFLKFYGGMGSFNDLVLNAPPSANDALDEERRKAYQLAQKLR